MAGLGHLAWRSVTQSVMQAHVIVKREPRANVAADLGNRRAGLDEGE
jgi:hypothetical protein